MHIQILNMPANVNAAKRKHQESQAHVLGAGIEGAVAEVQPRFGLREEASEADGFMYSPAWAPT